MTQDLNTALLLLVVGMITVFVILLLVVASGRTIIRIVNHYSKDVPSRSSPARLRPRSSTDSSGISPAKVAAIVAAVQQYTNGQGKVVNIESIKKS